MVPPPDDGRRFGVIISRKFSRLAVVRNRARRLMRETYRQLLPELRPVWFLLIPRHRMIGVKCQVVYAEVRRLSVELGVLIGPTAGGQAGTEAGGCGQGGSSQP